MRFMKTLYSFLFVLLIPMTISCAGDEDADFVTGDAPGFDSDGSVGPSKPDSDSCKTPGTWVDCECPDGSTGQRICEDDHHLSDVCACTTNTGGSGGSSGTGGSGGDAGSGGSAGTSGSGGTAGSSGTGGTAGTGGSGGSPPTSMECFQHGLDGKIVVVANAPIDSAYWMMLGGWIDVPGWCGSSTQDSEWCVGDPGQNLLVCDVPNAQGDHANACSGTYIEMWPGIHYDNDGHANAWYCDATGCPIGTFVICTGKDEEAGRSQNGVASGCVDYEMNIQGTGYNIVCTLP